MKKLSYLFLLLPFYLFLNACTEPAVEQTEEIVEEIEEIAEEKSDAIPVVEIEKGAFDLPSLNYTYHALEPHIDAVTMETHYSKHHAGYTKKLNKAVEGTDFAEMRIEDVLKKLDLSNAALRNNAGGYYNHNLYWEVMSPNGGGEPKDGAFKEDLLNTFESFENFKTAFSSAAGSRFGSGWAWLYINADGKLAIGSTANQDNPLMSGLEISGFPILGLDVWEHAYYLEYKNKRGDYINAFFNVLNWDAVEAKYNKYKEYQESK
jgi:Fe-Mn family superoxide dismutase